MVDNSLHDLLAPKIGFDQKEGNLLNKATLDIKTTISMIKAPETQNKVSGILSRMNFGVKKSQVSDDLDKPVWDKKKSWKDRKKEAIDNLKYKDDLHSTAYNGDYGKFKQKILKAFYLDETISFEEKEEKLEYFIKQFELGIIKSDQGKSEFNTKIKFKFIPNKDCLTPLIFAIWGLIDYGNKSDSAKCLEFLLMMLACNVEDHIKDLSNELGLLYTHCLDKSNTILGNNKILEVIIKKDLPVSLGYIIENASPVINFLRNKIEESNILILAIKNESLESINILFTSINQLEIKDFILFPKHIETEFYQIFKTRSGLLAPFLDKLMESGSIKVSVNKNDLPLIAYYENINLKPTEVNNPNPDVSKLDESTLIPNSKNQIIEKDNIYKYGIEKDKESKPDTVKVLNSLIRLPSINGSQSSYEFMVNLILNSSTEIYKSKIIQYYIKKKWDSLWDMIFLQSLLLWSNLVLVVVWISSPDYWYVASLIIVNSILFVFELFQMRSLGIQEYFRIIDFYSFLYLGSWSLFIYYYFLAIHPIITFVICCVVYFLSQLKNYENNIDKIITEIIFFWNLFNLIFTEWMKVSESVFIAYFVGQGIILGILMYISASQQSRSFVYFLIILVHFRVFFLIDYAIQGTKDLFLVSQIASYGIMYLTFSIFLLFKEQNTIAFIAFIFTSLLASFTTLFYFLDYTSTNVGFYICFLFFLILETAVVAGNLKRKITGIKYGLPHMILILFAISFYSDRKTLYYFIVYLVLEVASQYLKSKKYFIKLSENVFSFVFNWNTIDMIRVVVFFTWVVFWFVSEPSNGLTWALTLMSFIRGLTAFRCFNGTRYYVRLIFKCIVDIKAFLIIVCYSTLGFGLIRTIYTLNPKNDTLPFESLFVDSFNQDFGNGDPINELTFEYFIYLIACTINIIVMLNLLISVLGKSFENFNETTKENDYMEMADAICEVENILFYRRKFPNSKDELGYLLVWDNWIDDPKANETEGAVENSNTESLEDSIKNIETKIADLDEKLEKVLSCVQAKS